MKWWRAVGSGRWTMWSRWSVSWAWIDDDISMVGRSFDHCLESVDVVCGISDGSYGSVGIYKRVLSLNHVAMTSLRVRLYISGGGVVYAILEIEGGMVDLTGAGVGERGWSWMVNWS